MAVLLAVALCLVVLSGRWFKEMPMAGHALPMQPAEPDGEPPQGTDKTTLRQEFDELTRDKAITAEKGLPTTSGGLASPDTVLPPPARNPLIAHTADLTVATREFARSREMMEEILERHRGYAAKLRMVGQKRGSVLSATLRVPSTELPGAVADLKALGDVEREEQAADETTEQHADLEARLTNARNTLRRLEELLRQQTYPDGNVRELQRQIASASVDVARLEAERRSSELRVVFANVYFTLREELATPSETFGAQLHGALASGFGEALASLSALLVVLIGRGPVVLLWCAIFYLPVRWAWKRLAAQSAAVVEQAS